MNDDDFDFDYWKDLYEKDPEEADRQRLALLRQKAASLSGDEEARDRLLAKVFHQTMELDRIKNPVERLNQLQVRFWTMFTEFHDALHGRQIAQDTSRKADVIPFKAHADEKEEEDKETPYQ